MIIYTVAVVTRYKDGGSEGNIAEVDFQRNFRSLERARLYIQSLIKKGYDYLNIDVTKQAKFGLQGVYDYAGTLDSKTLTDKGF